MRIRENSPYPHISFAGVEKNWDSFSDPWKFTGKTVVFCSIIKKDDIRSVQVLSVVFSIILSKIVIEQ